MELIIKKNGNVAIRLTLSQENPSWDVTWSTALARAKHALQVAANAVIYEPCDVHVHAKLSMDMGKSPDIHHGVVEGEEILWADGPIGNESMGAKISTDFSSVEFEFHS